ncbi:MAG: hypothetical protein U9Q07_11825 [Planctomycetota bacterium]|nr:hypothetical protein [Planctomycetota bacterium]
MVKSINFSSQQWIFHSFEDITQNVTVHGANMPILSRYGRLSQLYRKKLIKKAFAQQEKLL